MYDAILMQTDFIVNQNELVIPIFRHKKVMYVEYEDIILLVTMH